MSDPLRVHVVCEGKTDAIVIAAALKAVTGKDLLLTMIQPEQDATQPRPLGEGWKGVRSWCWQLRDDFGGFEASPSLIAADLLVLHVDADIVSDIDCDKLPCPPAENTTTCVGGRLLEWMGERSCPRGLVLCIPSKATEAWVFAALFADQMPDLECLDDPARALYDRRAQKPDGRRLGLVTKRSGSGAHGLSLKKQVVRYRELAPWVERNWPDIRYECEQAERFSVSVEEGLG